MPGGARRGCAFHCVRLLPAAGAVGLASPCRCGRTLRRPRPGPLAVRMKPRRDTPPRSRARYPRAPERLPPAADLTAPRSAVALRDRDSSMPTVGGGEIPPVPRVANHSGARGSPDARAAAGRRWRGFMRTPRGPGADALSVAGAGAAGAGRGAPARDGRRRPGQQNKASRSEWKGLRPAGQKKAPRSGKREKGRVLEKI